MVSLKGIKSILLGITLCYSVSMQAANAVTDPREVVEQYINALKAYEFKTAYVLVSKDMRQEMGQAQWANVHKEMFTGADVKILSHQTFPAVYKDTKAIVPNWIIASDKILNKDGAKEFEIYTLVKEGDEWRIDNQELLFESEELDRWFPKK